MLERPSQRGESPLEQALRAYLGAEDRLRHADITGDRIAAAQANEELQWAHQRVVEAVTRYARYRASGRSVLGYEAEDVAQEALTRFHLTRPASREPGSCAAWLCKAVRRQIIDLLRKRSVRRNVDAKGPNTAREAERLIANQRADDPIGGDETPPSWEESLVREEDPIVAAVAEQLRTVLDKAHAWIQENTGLQRLHDLRWLFERRLLGFAYKDLCLMAPETSHYHGGTVPTGTMQQHLQRYQDALARVAKANLLDKQERGILERALASMPKKSRVRGVGTSAIHTSFTTAGEA